MKQTFMQYGTSLLLVLLCLLVLPSCDSKDESLREASSFNISLYFFHDTACGSCDGTSEFLSIFEEQLGDIRELYPYTLEMQNVFYTAGNNRFKQVMEQYHLNLEQAYFPMLILNGKMISGLDEIEKSLRESFLSAGEVAETPDELAFTVETAPADDLFCDFPKTSAGESVVLYFYRSTCPDCIETKEFLEKFPQSIEIDGKKSKVTIYSLNSRIGSNPERIRFLFEKYQVPQEKQVVPIIFLRQSYLSGYEEISVGLEKSLSEKGGQNFDFTVF